jgi:predicted nucleotidyltransferase component of viral defense system
MISKQEIMDLTREFSLGAETVEKDYVLGWLLAGIANQPELLDQWVFKGGTCLKKCYFETYRFSEDLDYTLVNAKHVDENFLVNCFYNIADWIYDSSGIEISKKGIRFERLPRLVDTRLAMTKRIDCHAWLIPGSQ